ARQLHLCTQPHQLFLPGFGHPLIAVLPQEAGSFCLVSYPCIVAWVIYKNRFVDYLFLTLLACLGSIFSVVLYKQPDYSLTIYQAVAVGYAAVIMPTVLVLSVVNIFMGKAERTCK
ncbi:hypothetical protein ACYA65_25705, partial [Klebsiella pneumoniae]